MVLDGRPAQADLVVELTGAEHVIPGQAIVAVHAPRLADADLGREARERRVLVAGHPLHQEAGVLQRLAATVDLGPRQEPRIGGVGDAVGTLRERVQAGHDGRRHARHRRAVIRSVAARQRMGAGRCGLPHQGLDRRTVDGRAPVKVDVGHPERGRERLRIPGIGRALIAEARVMTQVGIARGIDEHRPHDPAQARLGGHHDIDDATVLDRRRLDERVEQRTGTGGLDEVAPHDLEVCRQVGDPGPGAEGVRDA